MNTLAELSVIDINRQSPQIASDSDQAETFMASAHTGFFDVLRCFVQEGPGDANKGFGMVAPEKRRRATSPTVESPRRSRNAHCQAHYAESMAESRRCAE